jgi:outer membrane protein OmpA-like peptidoglycan-associated protein
MLGRYPTLERAMNAKWLRALSLAALVLGFSNVAAAREGWYGRADIGWSVDGALEVAGTDLDFDDDWSAHVAAGRAFANGFRVEGELAHRQNDFSDFSGDVRATSLMLNAYYDFNREGRFRPYVGLGVGAANVDASGAIGPISFNDDDTVAAYQGMVGVAIPLTERLDLDIGYRYFVAPDAGFSGTVDIEGPEPFSFDGDYEHQAVTVGMRYRFGAHAAAAAPAPAPVPPPTPVAPQPAVCPTNDFVVYFEWDRSNLDASALETIDAAVRQAQQCNLSAVAVVGHTDTSGSTRYNEGLSVRRASVVHDALTQRGVNATLITTDALGETALARPTGDGVREPLNRRTTVTITFR